MERTHWCCRSRTSSGCSRPHTGSLNGGRGSRCSRSRSGPFSPSVPRGRTVQVALGNLKTSGLMSPAAIVGCPEATLHEVVRPSGFYRQKSRYVRAFSLHVLDRYDGRMDRMRCRPLVELRNELLEIDGIGPETADTIMLYALGLPSFVVDSYSFKLLNRLGMYSGRDYAHVKIMVEDALGLDAKRLSSAHAVIVTHCKDRCRARPLCIGCPLSAWCPSESHDDY